MPGRPHVSMPRRCSVHATRTSGGRGRRARARYQCPGRFIALPAWGRRWDRCVAGALDTPATCAVGAASTSGGASLAPPPLVGSYRVWRIGTAGRRETLQRGTTADARCICNTGMALPPPSVRRRWLQALGGISRKNPRPSGRTKPRGACGVGRCACGHEWGSRTSFSPKKDIILLNHSPMLALGSTGAGLASRAAEGRTRCGGAVCLPAREIAPPDGGVRHALAAHGHPAGWPRNTPKEPQAPSLAGGDAAMRVDARPSPPTVLAAHVRGLYTCLGWSGAPPPVVQGRSSRGRHCGARVRYGMCRCTVRRGSRAGPAGRTPLCTDACAVRAARERIYGMDSGRRTTPWKWCAATHRLCRWFGPCLWLVTGDSGWAGGGGCCIQGRVATEKGSRKAWSEGVCRLMSAWSPPSSDSPLDGDCVSPFLLLN